MVNDCSRWVEVILRVLETGCKSGDGVLPNLFTRKQVFEIVKEVLEKQKKPDVDQRAKITESILEWLEKNFSPEAAKNFEKEFLEIISKAFQN